MSRIMGIDASGSCTGIAIFDTEESCFIHVSKIHSAIRKATPTNAKRREKIVAEISYLLWMHEVDTVVMEDIYINKKSQASSIIPLAALRGAIEQLVLEMGYEQLHIIESTKIKKAVTGAGNASKYAVYNKLKELYADDPVVMEALGEELLCDNNLKKNEDMSDAVATVYAYCQDPTLAHAA